MSTRPPLSPLIVMDFRGVSVQMRRSSYGVDNYRFDVLQDGEVVTSTHTERPALLIAQVLIAEAGGVA